MPLIVENGAGLPNADSYASLAEFRAYWSARNNAAAIAATDPQVEAALRTAFDYLNAAFTFQGQPTDVAQSGAFPRIGLASGNGYFPSNAIPRAVFLAQLTLALEGLTVDLLKRQDPTPQVIEDTKSLKGITKSLKFAVADTRDLTRLGRFPMVETLLRPMLLQRGNADVAMVPLRRVL